MHSRAYERELVRVERARERERLRAEREAERQLVAKERERADAAKQEAKNAQVRAWRLEYEEGQEREQEIDRIANESPEVEGRDALYAELRESAEFEGWEFQPPSQPSSDAAIRALRDKATSDVAAAVAEVRVDVSRAKRMRQLGMVTVLVGVSLWFVPATAATHVPLALTIAGAIAAIIVHVSIASAFERARAPIRASAEQRAAAWLEEALDVQARKDREHADRQLQEARARYEAELQNAQGAFEREESARQQAFDELLSGERGRLQTALDETFPLDLPIAFSVIALFASSTSARIELDVPEPSVLPDRVAKLSAAGKLSFAEKSPRAQREQYLRLVVGGALRHACEAMLAAPSLQLVQVVTFRTTVDPSVGHSVRAAVLDVCFDYLTLAPMTMDELDPVAALKHFKHSLNLDRERNLKALELE